MRAVRCGGWVFANLLIGATAAFAYVAHGSAPDLYYFISQEDHWVEWSTVWAFVMATAGYGVAARHDARVHGRLPWSYVGLAGFCFLVAMEEISWGQRLLSYRPPTYFLQDNFQQEFNLHNVVDSTYRRWALHAVIIGYGVLLPLTRLVPALRRWTAQVGIRPPPTQLVPAFAATSAMYYLYPVSFTGEWVELMLGLGMLFAAALAAASLRQVAPARYTPAPGLTAGVAASMTLLLGILTVGLSSFVHSGSPQAIALATTEIEALRRDFEHDRVATRCGVHKRVYSFQRDYGQTYLQQGAFARLQHDSLDANRTRFFLDPWHMPYWIRHTCAKQGSREVIFVYSFGPNRRRDSTKQQINADDIGSVWGEPMSSM